MHVIVTSLFIWFLPWYTWEAILPEKQRVPKCYAVAEVKTTRPFDTKVFNNQHSKSFRMTSRKMLDK